jgi:hypothetical protein
MCAVQVLAVLLIAGTKIAGRAHIAQSCWVWVCSEMAVQYLDASGSNVGPKPVKAPNA